MPLANDNSHSSLLEEQKCRLIYQTSRPYWPPNKKNKKGQSKLVRNRTTQQFRSNNLVIESQKGKVFYQIKTT